MSLDQGGGPDHPTLRRHPPTGVAGAFCESHRFLARGGLRVQRAGPYWKHHNIHTGEHMDVHHIRAWESEHGSLPEGGWLLMRTGWKERSQDRQHFLNKDKQGNPHSPGFTVECAQWIAEESALSGIGVETVGIDAGAVADRWWNRQPSPRASPDRLHKGDVSQSATGTIALNPKLSLIQRLVFFLLRHQPLPEQSHLHELWGLVHIRTSCGHKCDVERKGPWPWGRKRWLRPDPRFRRRWPDHPRQSR